VEHLKLALAWNRFDVAKDEIFSGGAFWKVCTLVHFYAIIQYILSLQLYAHLVKHESVNERTEQSLGGRRAVKHGIKDNVK